MATNLKDFCKNIADSIRAKEGSSDLISPMDFAQRIDNLQVGGGADESSIEYLDVSGASDEGVQQIFLMFSILVKYSTVYGTVIFSPFATANLNFEKQLKAVMIDFTMQIAEMGVIGTIKDAFIQQGFTQEDIDAIPRITKEQFYDLTT